MEGEAPPPVRCPLSHPMEPFAGDDAFYLCNSCQRQFREAMFGCRLCDFDLCQSCHQVQAEAGGAQSPLLTPRDVQRLDVHALVLQMSGEACPPLGDDELAELEVGRIFHLWYNTQPQITKVLGDTNMVV
jgi:hypothetical protein